MSFTLGTSSNTSNKPLFGQLCLLHLRLKRSCPCPLSGSTWSGVNSFWLKKNKKLDCYGSYVCYKGRPSVPGLSQQHNAKWLIKHSCINSRPLCCIRFKSLEWYDLQIPVVPGKNQGWLNFFPIPTQRPHLHSRVYLTSPCKVSFLFTVTLRSGSHILVLGWTPCSSTRQTYAHSTPWWNCKCIQLCIPCSLLWVFQPTVCLCMSPGCWWWKGTTWQSTSSASPFLTYSTRFLCLFGLN